MTKELWRNFQFKKVNEDMLPRHGGLTVFPQVLDEVAGGVVEQRGHIVIQRIHVLSQPISSIIVDLEKSNDKAGVNLYFSYSFLQIPLK